MTRRGGGSGLSERWRSIRAIRRYLYNVACTYSQLGFLDKALDCLDRATPLGSGHRPWVEKDPDLDPIRNHLRFAAILTRI